MLTPGAGSRGPLRAGWPGLRDEAPGAPSRGFRRQPRPPVPTPPRAAGHSTPYEKVLSVVSPPPREVAMRRVPGRRALSLLLGCLAGLLPVPPGEGRCRAADPVREI